ncbi:relaxase/mobilization nuclease domain-containing protein [Olivibacter sp. 47]|uniref:relaxase/mobilization nuclease domain-containing protein n=1 Tax=Olivibacter sp. 47 TaxID=3056486 RepID=UPI0025A33F99|nr:relaxase/mobilization nuclease domain-containing protein [Olivibacter sp. 47]MDM8172916.1 relaxase/mobilization nuclease domain-containing protein [Olivibacter sp. 47]
MVAKIMIGKSIRGILHYNEQKVAEGSATLIMASGFADDIKKLNFAHKLTRFEHLTDLKPSVKTNALHISLNFHSSEKLADAEMQQIAAAYMEGIGFGDQPFLVYRHHDVSHQHFHIATVNIKKDGNSIDLHNIGRIKSEQARKFIEKEFGLIRAESKTYHPEPAIKAIDPEKIQYGHLPTKRAIGSVVTTVMNSYKFTSLAEFNAVLKQFNVVVDRGSEESEMFRQKGLLYSVLDRQGNKVGVPIKASSFYSKPILKRLERKFEQNVEKRKPYRDDLKERIDQVLNRYEGVTKQTLNTELQKSEIALVFRQNEEGFIYGTTFIDHRCKTVFNGSSLGKAYSAKALKEKLAENDKVKTYLAKPKRINSYLKPHNEKKHLQHAGKINFSNLTVSTTTDKILKDLLNPEYTGYAPSITSKKKKRQIKRKQP